MVAVLCSAWLYRREYADIDRSWVSIHLRALHQDEAVERRRAELTDRITIEVEADGFLYNMVRNIVGTLVQVGKDKEPPDWPAQVLALRDRGKPE